MNERVTSDLYHYFAIFLHSLDHFVQRGEEQNDPTIASDILGFVKKRIDSSDVEDVSPEILKYVLEESEESDNQDSDDSTTETIIAEDSMEEVIIEGEFLEAEDESCGNDADYQILDSKSYSMSSSEVATDNSTATIMFQQVDVEGETKVNFGK